MREVELAFYPNQRGRIARAITLIEINDNHRRAATLGIARFRCRTRTSENEVMAEYYLCAAAAGLAW